MLCLWAGGVQISEGLGAAGLAGTALVAALAFPREVEVKGALRRWWPLWSFVAWALLGPLLGARGPSGSGLARVLDWLGVPLAAFAAARMTPRHRRVVMAVAGGVFVLSFAAAGLQSFGVWPRPETMKVLGYFHHPYLRVYEQGPVPGRFMGGGLLFHRLKFSHVSALVALWALALGLQARRPAVRISAYALAALVVTGIGAFAFARAALVALVLAAALLILAKVRHRRRGAVVLVAVLVLGGALVGLSPSMRARFAVLTTAHGGEHRDALLATGVRAVRAHPLLGLGMGRFHPRDYATSSTPEDVRENAGKAHNQLLSLAAEAGLPGALLFVVLLVWLFYKFDGSTVSGSAGRACLVFFALLSSVHDPLFQAPFSLALVLALGCASAPGLRPSTP